MDEKQILIKLKAHKNFVDSNKARMIPNLSIHAIEFDDFVEPFEKYRKELVLVNPDLYGDFKPKPYGSAYTNDNYYYVWGLSILSENIQYLIDISPEESIITEKEFNITTEGIFFAGQYFDAFIKIAEILTKAKSEIILIDGYINEQFLSIFTTVSDNVRIKILTKSSTVSVDTGIIMFNKQFAKNSKVIELKVSGDFHDRFVIIDRIDFYHFGASLKDAGNKGFMFSKIEEPVIRKSLLAEFDDKW